MSEKKYKKKALTVKQLYGGDEKSLKEEKKKIHKKIDKMIEASGGRITEEDIIKRVKKAVMDTQRSTNSVYGGDMGQQLAAPEPFIGPDEIPKAFPEFVYMPNMNTVFQQDLSKINKKALKNYIKILKDESKERNEERMYINKKVRQMTEKLNKKYGPAYNGSGAVGGTHVGSGAVGGGPVGGKQKEGKKQKRKMSIKQKEWMDYVSKLSKKPKYKDMSRQEVMKIASAKRNKKK